MEAGCWSGPVPTQPAQRLLAPWQPPCRLWVEWSLLAPPPLQHVDLWVPAWCGVGWVSHQTDLLQQVLGI